MACRGPESAQCEQGLKLALHSRFLVADRARIAESSSVGEKFTIILACSWAVFAGRKHVGAQFAIFDSWSRPPRIFHAA